MPEGQDPDDLVKAEGPEGFRRVLDESRPLADLLWMRETAGGVFETPERRAELEKTLRELTGRIRDESVRFHYQQEMRERVHAFFGSRRDERRSAQQGNRRGAGGWQGRGGFTQAGRTAVSESLARTALVKRAGGVMPLREAVLVVTLVNHPMLAEEFFDEVEALDLSHKELRQILTVLVDVLAHQAAHDRMAVLAAMESAGLAAVWERALEHVRRAGHWPALEAAALDDAREAFMQALQLHRGARTLHTELKAAEAALASEPTEENYRHLVEVQAEFRNLQAAEALIEGFGVLSGRVDRG
jgi:DNA primase